MNLTSAPKLNGLINNFWQGNWKTQFLQGKHISTFLNKMKFSIQSCTGHFLFHSLRLSRNYFASTEIAILKSSNNAFYTHIFYKLLLLLSGQPWNTPYNFLHKKIYSQIPILSKLWFLIPQNSYTNTTWYVALVNKWLDFGFLLDREKK